MILKASQRGGGADLAIHLMRADENEHVEIHEMRGFVSETLKDAFKETDAISGATQCRQYLFSLSLSPPERERVPIGTFQDAIDRIEARLGLTGQPRAVVFHEKEGRRHAHCVWSRIDAQTMTAKPLPFFKNKLMEVSRDLYLEHGWTMPRGIEDKGNRNPTNFSLAEWQQAKRQGIDPRWIKTTLQQCWKASDNAAALTRAVEERGFILAKGDRRSVVVLDYNGEVYALSRMLDLKTKDVRARIGDGEALPDVESAKKTLADRMTPVIRRHIAESRSGFRKRALFLDIQKAEMREKHRIARAKLDERLESEWRAETRERAVRLPKGLLSLWSRLTGQYQKLRAQNEGEAQATRARHGMERQALIDDQLRERSGLQNDIKSLRQRQARDLLDLRKDIAQYMGFARGDPASGLIRGKSTERDFEL